RAGGGVGLRRHAKIDGRLPQRQVALRNAEKMDRLHGRDALLERPRIGQTDVLDRDPDQTPRNVEAVFAGFEDTRQPAERGTGLARAPRLVQRRDQVEVLLSALVVELELARNGILDGGRG